MLRESSLRPRLRRSSTIIWKPPVWPRPRIGGGITTKATASWIPERSRLRPETIRSWVSPLPRSLQFLYTMNVVVTFGTLAKSRTENPPMVTHPASPSVLSRSAEIFSATARRPGLSGALGQDGHQDGVPLVLGGEEPGGLANEAPGGRPDDEGEEHDHEHRALHHPGDDAHVDLGHALERPVEPAVEPVRLAALRRRPQPQRALGRLQRQRVDRADDRGGGDDERELAEDLPGDAGKKAAGRKTAISTRVIPITGPVSSLMALMAASLGVQPLLDVVARCSPR